MPWGKSILAIRLANEQRTREKRRITTWTTRHRGSHLSSKTRTECSVLMMRVMMMMMMCIMIGRENGRIESGGCRGCCCCRWGGRWSLILLRVRERRCGSRWAHVFTHVAQELLLRLLSTTFDFILPTVFRSAIRKPDLQGRTSTVEIMFSLVERDSYLNSRFGKIDFLCQLFSSIDIWIVSAGES